jgi:HAE1 family hydrophobic/amphiphilic exporter-1
MSLPAFSVRQVVLVNLVFFLCMAAGLQALFRIPVDLFPDISFNSTDITTIWAGASPREVERLLTQKLEDEIDGIYGIKELYSSSSQSLSEIEVEWDETLSDLEYEAAVNDLRAAIDRADDLPEDAEAPYIRELSVSEVYNICIVAVKDVGGVGEFTLREVARDLRDRIERIPGLRKAEMRGARDRELRVLVDGNRAHQYDLTLAEISAVIARNNQNFAAGSLTDSDDREVTVRGLGQFVSPEGLARTVVKKNPDGSHVLLGDVAEVVSGFAKRRIFGRENGIPAISLGISKEEDVDLIDLVGRIRAFLEEHAARLPEGVEATITWNSADYVDVRMNIMRSNLLLGVVFVILILWLTVGFRNAVLAIVGIPFSFLAALILFPVFDITINSISLVGFIMVSGMVVDDAIIILENIYRRVEEGAPLLRAIVEGTEEVMWPVTAAVFTTMAAFIPMLTVSGTSGEFMSILPKTVIACLLGSLFEAMVILPAHYLDFGSRQKARDSLEATPEGLRRRAYQLRARVDAGIERFRDLYLAAQARILVHRYAFLGAGVAAVFFSVALSQHLRVDLFPSDFNQLMVSIETPTDFGVDQTDQVLRGLERALDPIGHELTDISSDVGVALNADQIPVVGVNQAMLWVSFPNTHENVANPDRVMDLVRGQVEEYRAAHPEGIVNLRVAPPRNGPPIGKPVAIRIQSDDYQEAKRIAGEMKAALAGMPGVYNIEDNVPVGPRELRVALDEHRASIHGLSFDDVGFALLAANDGAVPSSFKDPASDEDVDIRVLLQGDQRRSIADLLEVDIRTPGGYLVEIGDVAEIEIGRDFQRLYHFDAQRAVVVYADVDNDQATSVSVNREMRARFRDVPQRYPGVDLIFGGEFQETEGAFADMRRAFLLAVLAIFGILAAQFRSYVQPLIVMSVIVFSFIGVTVGMWAMGYALSMYVLYAIVGLAGIVVNGSLVLIDFVNRERERGTPPLEAVRIASSKRFRPIVLTTLTTVSALMPMALGLTGYSRVFGPFATAIVFGLSAASLLTLFVAPALYLVLEDASSRLRGQLEARRLARVTG